METSYGYTGKWAYIDLTSRKISIASADPRIYRDFVGGRGVQAYLMHEHMKQNGGISDPKSPANRIIIGSAAPNDTLIPTAGRGSCTFIGTMTRSPESASWKPDGSLLAGLLTHSSIGGLFPNMLKRAGFDHVIIDGKASSPVRILIADDGVEILDAETELFKTVHDRETVRPTSEVTAFLSGKHKGSSSLCTGPAGWNLVDYACLTADYHRNFGRGGAGAVFGSKLLVAVTVSGKGKPSKFDEPEFDRAVKELDASIKSDVADPVQTVSFRPSTGTTWWLDRAFNGGFDGVDGGYLPWRNFDEGSFDPSDYARVSTDAFLEIAGKPKVCNRCRHIFCTRSASVEDSPYAGKGVRPEFETIALWINCCILNRDAIFHLNHLCNELGIDTMTFGSVVSSAMELTQKGYLEPFGSRLAFGNADEMVKLVKAVAYAATPLGRLLGQYTDRVIAEIEAGAPAGAVSDIAWCCTSAFGGLGYAGVEPKAFPGMFTAYGTSNRGRGDHTYGWTVQAEEAGLTGEKNLAAYVAEGQWGKALIDSLGLCDFFSGSIVSDLFLSLYHALTGIEYTEESLNGCGRRIYALERYLNGIQGRDRRYDAYVPEKLTVPMTSGALKGRCVDRGSYHLTLDHYYEKQGWTEKGIADKNLLRELGITT